ncbi:MAG: MFS transporter [Bacillota bacterium]
MGQEPKRPLYFLLLFGLVHLIIDVYNGAVPALIPFLQDRYNLTYAAAGTILAISNVTSSLIQPVFGLFSDFFGGTWIITLGLLVAALGVAIAGYVSSVPLIISSVALAGVGVAIFHPQCAKMAGRVTSGKGFSMAVYSVGGNVGFALGPVVLGAVMAWLPHSSFWVIALPGLAGAALMELAHLRSPTLRGLASAKRKAGSEARAVAVEIHDAVNLWGAEAILLTVVALRSFVQYGVVTYMPQYAVRVLGQSAGIRPLLQFVFLSFGALGTLVGGVIVDRFGRFPVLMGSLALLVPLHLLLCNVSGMWFVVVLAVEGFVLVSSFTITLLMSQEYLPGFMGLASGLNVGFSVGMGGIGASVIGLIADAKGLPFAFKSIAFYPLLALALALLLPRGRGEHPGYHSKVTGMSTR